MNPDTSIAKTWYKYLRSIQRHERLFYAVMAYRYYYLDDDRIGLHDIDDYFTEDEFDRLRGAYKRERLDLQTEEVIEYVGEDGMYTKDYFRIKDEIKDEMLADLGGIKKDEKRVDVSASRKLSADAIGQKELFYNLAEGRQVAQLAQDFDFSGGQIENIARKREVQSIIGLCEPGFAQVREFCTEEIIEYKSSRRKIGFNAA